MRVDLSLLTEFKESVLEIVLHNFEEGEVTEFCS